MDARARVLLMSLLVLGSADPASAVDIDWVPVGDVSNACDPQPQGCFGSVDYSYQISKYEVTVAQYVEFLNAKASSDPLELYRLGMGITRSGSPGSYTYAAVQGIENMPIQNVSFYDAARFANWLHNGQGSGDTESGAYTLLGGTPLPSNGLSVTRNPGATVFLPTEDEWYKAAYYSALSMSYYDFPAGSDIAPTCADPTSSPNHANCFVTPPPPPRDRTEVGAYSGSPSPYGTFDQGGNVSELTETVLGEGRVKRGGGWTDFSFETGASARSVFPGTAVGSGSPDIGFRVGSIPEPATALLVTTGLLALGVWRAPSSDSRARRGQENVLPPASARSSDPAGPACLS